jgi:hypothetical protein
MKYTTLIALTGLSSAQQPLPTCEADGCPEASYGAGACCLEIKAESVPNADLADFGSFP